MTERYVFKEPPYVKSSSPSYSVFFGKSRLNKLANLVVKKIDVLIQREKELLKKGNELELSDFNKNDYRECVLKYTHFESYFKVCRMLKIDPDQERYHINSGYLNDNFYGFIQDHLSTFYTNIITGRVFNSVASYYSNTADRYEKMYMRLLEEFLNEKERK
jgi:hypothetical protein